MIKIKDWSEYNSYFFILESILNTTPEFFSIINNIRLSNNGNTSIIADKIFKLIDKDINTNVNYLSVSDKENEVSFIPDSQYNRYNSENINVSTKGRNYISVGRLVKQLLSMNDIDISDKELEAFVNDYKSYWTEVYGKLSIEIVKGEDILFWYLENNYHKERNSQLNSSCMRFYDRNKYIKIYADNPDVIKMIILREGDKIHARALLWELEDGEKFLDRIYYNQAHHRNLIINNIKKIEPKVDKIYDLSKIDSILKSKKINFKTTDYDYYPYIDTFYLLCVELDDEGFEKGTAFFETYNNLKNDNILKIELSSANGTYTRIKSDHVYIKSGGSHKWVSESKLVYSKIFNEKYYKDDCVNSNLYDSYIPKWLSVWSDTHDSWILEKSSENDEKYGIVDNRYKVFAIVGLNNENTDIIECEEALTKENNQKIKELFKKEYVYKKTKNGFNYRYFNFDESLKIENITGGSVPNFLAYDILVVGREDTLDEKYDFLFYTTRDYKKVILKYDFDFMEKKPRIVNEGKINLFSLLDLCNIVEFTERDIEKRLEFIRNNIKNKDISEKRIRLEKYISDNVSY